MAEQLLDGTGTGKRAKVDVSNRLHTHSVTETIIQNAARTGDSYNINSGPITLTTASQSALLYFKNTGDSDIHIAAVGYLIGNSTGGAGDFHATVVKNPTTGTVISDAVAVAINENKNVGSSKILDIETYKGAEGKTFTNGEDFYFSLLGGAARTYVISTGTIVVPNGGSIGVNVTPQIGNTSMEIQIFMSVTEYNLD